MSETDSHPVEAPAKPLFSRMAMAFFVFASVLSVMLFVSSLYVLPLFQTVDVAGVPHDIASLDSLKADLVASISEAEKKRDTLVLPEQEQLHETLKAMRTSTPSFEAAHTWIMEQVRSLNAKDSIVISAFNYVPATKTVALTGDVRGVGPRSMTLLAEFIDALRHIPGVATLEGERYVREDDAKVGPHSPFALTLTLQ